MLSKGSGAVNILSRISGQRTDCWTRVMRWEGRQEGVDRRFGISRPHEDFKLYVSFIIWIGLSLLFEAHEKVLKQPNCDLRMKYSCRERWNINSCPEDAHIFDRWRLETSLELFGKLGLHRERLKEQEWARCWFYVSDLKIGGTITHALLWEVSVNSRESIAIHTIILVSTWCLFFFF